MKKIIKDTIALFLITLVAGLSLGFVYQVTKEPIASQKQQAKIDAYNKVFETLDSYQEVKDLESIQTAIFEAGYDGVELNEAVMAFDSSKEQLGYIITVTDQEGYSGDIKLTVGISTDGTITGLEFLTLNETAGLGMKAKESWFKDQYVGIQADIVEYIKTGKTADNQIDAISSATITTNAVTNGVNGALVAYRQLGGNANE